MLSRGRNLLADRDYGHSAIPNFKSASCAHGRESRGRNRSSDCNDCRKGKINGTGSLQRSTDRARKRISFSASCSSSAFVTVDRRTRDKRGWCGCRVDDRRDREKSTKEKSMIYRNGQAVVGFGLGDRVGLGFGKPGDWYYTRIIYPDDIRAAKRRVDALFQSVDHDVKSCTALNNDDRATWGALFISWRKLYCLSDKTDCTEPDASYFGLGGQMDDVERYEKSAYEWQLKLQAKTCTPSAPIIKPDAQKREEADHRADIAGTVKVVAVAVVGAVAIVYLAPKLIPDRSK
jgi:hypothetical protein